MSGSDSKAGGGGRFALSDRLSKRPPYLFAEIDRMKRAARAKGVDIIDLGVGDPDQPTPPHIVKKLQASCAEPRYHRYPSYEGMLPFRESVAGWCQRRFGVKLDAASEVVSLIGSKEGIAHLPLAFVNPGDATLVTDPGYPVYSIATLFAGGEPVSVPLRAENGFLPDLDAIPPKVLDRAKILFLNYPNNPTSAIADLAFYTRVAEKAARHGFLVAADSPYSEITFDGYRAPSFLEAPGAKEVGVEFHSLSKTYNMTGWRCGFAVGNPQVIAGLGKIKTNVDSGIFEAIQVAGMEALEGDQSCIEEMRKLYAERRDVFVAGLMQAGIEVKPPKATFYVWAPVPKGYGSADFAAHLLEKSGIVATPGNGFGPAGEGYIRFSLTVDKARLAEAVARIQKTGF
ncbi:MAG: LL-diaminopimelate aminotransferase [Deltaproteobacteria bacterium]|nr:LL-diaminopimelate aminotransferase [Deltaproteobacteria bacterium]